METLEADEVFLPLEQVETIHSTYWRTFAKLKEFSRKLYYEWKRNGGYILNGMGRPMAVPEDMNKDLLSRFIQSTGHDILVKYVYILTHNLDNEGILWKPIVIDWHDSTTIEVSERDAERTVAIFEESMLQLNAELQGTIQLKGTPVVGRNLSDCKEPSE